MQTMPGSGCRRARQRLLRPLNSTGDFSAIALRQHPELYSIGQGEQGVLLVAVVPRRCQNRVGR